MVVVLFLLGLVTGSFLGVLTYRLPRGGDIISDRSRCPFCKRVIRWYDNIPLLSFLILRGRCRSCRKEISVRYPLFELGTAVIFVLVGPNILYLILASILISIFVIDLEHQVIPDGLVFIGLIAVILNLKLEIFSNLLAGLLAADLLLFLNLITEGKGMGLGDVKLAILIGTIVGMRLFLVWLFFSFLVGAIISIILLIFKKANLKKQVAFGPFLIIGVWLTYLFGQNFLMYLNL